MQPTQTGIATALALVVVIAFFMVPGLWPFHSANTASTTKQTATVATATDTQVQNTTNTVTTTNPTAPMPPTQGIDAKELSAKDLVVGTGATAAAGDVVTVNYVGSLTNGTVFDASANHGTTGFSFKLGAGFVIKGWDQGIVGMKEGGKRVLVIPASMAYGSQAVGTIPPNSTLLFEVEMLKVQKGAQ